jgi:hypothetical protein
VFRGGATADEPSMPPGARMIGAAMPVGSCFEPPTATPSALTLIGSTGVCWMRMVGCGGGAPAAGVIFGTIGGGIPLAGVSLLPWTFPDGATGVPAIGVMRRGTIPAMPPTSVPPAMAARLAPLETTEPGASPVGEAMPAGGVLLRGTMGGGLADPVPMSVFPPRGGGRELPLLPPGAGGGLELALAFASARARAASSITARAEAGSADVRVVWMSAGAAAGAAAAGGLAGAGGSLGEVRDEVSAGGALGEDVDGGAFTSPS